jgi:coenzyme F420-0:L-glutamate ligase / coenzyme F420-1:gamma-L-glutamate ligase
VSGLQLFGVVGLPEIAPGTDLALAIFNAAAAADTPLASRDVIVVGSKIVSKTEGQIVHLDSITPSAFAQRWSEKWDKDPRLTEVVL